ncbi:hypothetical protein G6F40_015253 [Rhizopus arrhizus]|nr:hypothetical protein G6F40_015253 [Rhizopus arrhizus]
MSRARRRAMASRVRGCMRIPSAGKGGIGHLGDTRDEDARRHDGFGRQFAQLDLGAHLHNGGLGRHAHDGTEVARALVVGQVAPAVAQMGADQRVIAAQRMLQHVAHAVDHFLATARGQFGAVAAVRPACPAARIPIPPRQRETPARTHRKWADADASR